ncbi:hypothetical protein K504DRAFT_506715 [Pleomassaria siparia CBS 279.74]|uniref:Fe2OG dioxygenase domain-containing protein n=1 Tax=Pleomassaria siparia CBS 279.74 TaxID=1314801 RepID=A0A6G1JWW4_9PLEO|nr:hypothetical protein K504DRAFT_506715 [Pleomassaria siparia CBS 279.74]
MPPKKKSKSESSAVVKSSKPPPPPPPNWPALQPLIPASDLSLHELLPGQIITVPNLWTTTLCKNYVSFLSSLPLTTTPGKPNKGDAVRVNDRFQIDDASFAERLWSGTALKNLVLGLAEYGTLDLSDAERNKLWGGQVIGLNPNIRVYRYSTGQFFDQHYDDFNNVVIPGSPAMPARTTWTLLLYLTSPATGCIGGETVFYPEPAPRNKKSKEPPPEPFVVHLEVGLALLHRHGADCMLHEGRPVLEGEKWVIRSDLCIVTHAQLRSRNIDIDNKALVIHSSTVMGIVPFPLHHHCHPPRSLPHSGTRLLTYRRTIFTELLTLGDSPPFHLGDLTERSHSRALNTPDDVSYPSKPVYDCLVVPSIPT